ncbi:MAG TPA: VOC family protein [Acidimicrobiales bacterium]|nr:VOC family protein [Acidimicrobiales bacterium]
MTDPFMDLHRPVDPVDPDPRFAARLRARLERALALPEGVEMPRTVVPPEPVAPTDAGADPTGVTPYLAVGDARAALAWYAGVWGARPRGEPVVMADGRIGHAELSLAGGVLMLADEYPDLGVRAPAAGTGSAVTLHLAVADVDSHADRAVDAGARLERPPADHPYGRNAVVIDPFGHRWLLAGASRPVAPPGPGPTAVAYASLWLPDIGAAAAFYAAVLGWRYAVDGDHRGRRVEGVSPALGLWGGQEQRTTLLCFAVDDLRSALARIRAAGGRAGEPRSEPYGVVADCADDQGLAFSLVEADHVPPGGGQRPAAPGELAYVTIGVIDSARARTFFSAVLGWRFSPGRVEDGWDIEGVSPHAGMHGGNPDSVVKPMFAVDDIATAVGRVRAAGGTATDPEPMPYGITADCTDDQGFAFFLGQLA